MASERAIPTDRFSERLRERGVDVSQRQLLVTKFAGSLQETDLTEPANCQGYGRIRHFRMKTSDDWPDNPLPISPAVAALGWHETPHQLNAQVFQNAICNWRCWYCFVDFSLLAGNLAHADWFTADELVDLYLTEPTPPPVIDLTGGQPDLTPEWVPWMMEALIARDIHHNTYLWSDDNLSNDYFFTKLTDADRKIVDSYLMYGKVCCFKGFDAESFAFNTRAAPYLFARQFELMGRLLRETQIDLYCYVTLTTSSEYNIEAGVRSFVDRLQELDPNLPLRTIPLEITEFSPVTKRLNSDRERALRLQQTAVHEWNAQIQARFSNEQLETDISAVSLTRG